MLRTNRLVVLRSRSSLCVLLIFVALGVVTAREPVDGNWHRDWDSAWHEAQAQDRPILCFVTMESCYYCEKMSRDTYSNRDVLQLIQRDYVLASTDVNRDPELIRRLNIRQFPTTLIIGADASVVDAITGYVGPEQLRARLMAAGRISRR
jgi:thioredoxin-related protein